MTPAYPPILCYAAFLALISSRVSLALPHLLAPVVSRAPTTACATRNRAIPHHYNKYMVEGLSYFSESTVSAQYTSLRTPSHTTQPSYKHKSQKPGSRNRGGQLKKTRSRMKKYIGKPWPLVCGRHPCRLGQLRSVSAHAVEWTLNESRAVLISVERVARNAPEVGDGVGVRRGEAFYVKRHTNYI